MVGRRKIFWMVSDDGAAGWATRGEIVGNTAQDGKTEMVEVRETGARD